MNSRCCALIIVFCPFILASHQNWRPADRLIATIDSRAVCLSELHAYIDFFRPELRPGPEQVTKKILDSAREELINRQLALDFFKKLFVPIYLPELLNRKREIIQQRFMGPEEFHNRLTQTGFTALTLGEWIKEDYILTWGINRRFGYGPGDITDTEIKEFITRERMQATMLWRDWLSRLTEPLLMDTVTDLILERRMINSLSELAIDLKKQKTVTLKPLIQRPR